MNQRITQVLLGLIAIGLWAIVVLLALQKQPLRYQLHKANDFNTILLDTKTGKCWVSVTPSDGNAHQFASITTTIRDQLDDEKMPP